MTTAETPSSQTSVNASKTRQNRVSAFRGSPATNPYIFAKKTVWMQRVADAVRAGAQRYIQGSTDLVKVPYLVEKFAKRYPVNLGKAPDRRARAATKTVTRWLGYLDEKSGKVHWALFVWPGQDFDPKSDAWRHPIDDRFRHSGYELVRLTKPKPKPKEPPQPPSTPASGKPDKPEKPKKKGDGKPVLTWRYERDRFNELHDEIVQVIRARHDAVLDQIIHSLHRSPGFAGIRQQVKKLWQITRAEWKRTRAKAEEPPKIPAQIGYVRRLPDVGMVWSELMQQAKKGKKDGNQEPTETPRRKARANSILVPPGVGGAAEKP